MAVAREGREVKPVRSIAGAYAAEWGFASLAALLGVLSAGEYPWNWMGIFLISVGWLARAVRTGGQFFPASPANLPLAAFMLSAVAAVWVAPDPRTALARFSLILAAASLYLLLLDSRARDRRLFSFAFASLVGLGSLFIFTQMDWSSAGGRAASLAPFVSRLSAVVPTLPITLPEWDVLRNVIAALAGLALIFTTAAGWEAWQAHRRAYGSVIFALLAGLLLLGVLAATTSRTPWIIFLALAGIVLLWRSLGRIVGPGRRGRLGLFWLVLGAAVLALGLLLGWQAALLDRRLGFTGVYAIGERQEIYAQAWELGREKPFTGAGLGAFPAAYSTYIRLIPFRSFLDESTGSNAYLNLLVEQGWLGLLAYTVLLVIPLGVGLRRLEGDASPYTAAGMLAVVFMAVYGLSHATLVATRALPLLFAPLGLALAGCADASRGEMGRSPVPVFHPGTAEAWLVGGLLVLLSAGAFVPGIRAQAMANLGAVEMDRQELGDFPRNEWVYAPEAALPPRAGEWFRRALAQDEGNMTANFRLGQAAMQAGDYPLAVEYLARAETRAPQHRGVRKSLGYSLLWAGETEQASLYLDGLPEIQAELEAYIFWWQQNDRRELSELARQMLALLKTRSKGIATHEQY